MDTNDTAARHWIGGTWVRSSDQKISPSYDPATGNWIGEFSDGGRAEAEQAVRAARDAFMGTPWSDSPRLRAAVIMQIALRIEAEAERLARLLTVENGKPLSQARGEISGTVAEFRYYAALAAAISGRTIQIAPGVSSYLPREPAGVAGIIVPWNAPAILLARSLAPALAAGCTCVIKAAPQTAQLHGEIIKCIASVEACPVGVINSITETGSDAAQALVNSANVDVLSFTGSSAVGKKIMEAAATSLKRLSLELGGKAPALVFPDAAVEEIAPKIAAAGIVAAGQQCTALSRVLVHRTSLERMREALVASLNRIEIGPGLDPQTEMGPMIDRRNRDRVLNIVADAHRHGTIRLSGRDLDTKFPGGAFLTPSVIETEDLAAPIVQQEVFGPVFTLESFDSEQEAVFKANATRYGLSASVWTRDIDRAYRVGRALRCGTVWINDHNKLVAESETGGLKESGFGRLHGVEAVGEFLHSKHIYHQFGTMSAR